MHIFTLRRVLANFDGRHWNWLIGSSLVVRRSNFHGLALDGLTEDHIPKHQVRDEAINPDDYEGDTYPLEKGMARGPFIDYWDFLAGEKSDWG